MTRREVIVIGELTTLTCPLCTGRLTQFNGDFPPLFRCASGHVYTDADLGAGSQMSGTNQSARGVVEERVVISNDYGSEESAIEMLTAYGLQAAMAAPVYGHGAVVGSLVVSTLTERRFSEADAETLARTLPYENGKTGGDRLRLARVHYWLGSEHMARNELSATVSYLEQVLEEARGLDDRDLQTMSSVVLGATRTLRGDFIHAEEFQKEALEHMKPTASFDRWEWTGAIGYLCVTLAARGQVAAGLALRNWPLTLETLKSHWHWPSVGPPSHDQLEGPLPRPWPSACGARL